MPEKDVEHRKHQLGLHFSGTNPERGSIHNQRVTLQAIRARGRVSRAELAQITGLTAPAVAGIVERLLDSGLIRSAGQRQGLRGQPAQLLSPNADGAFSIGVNVDRDHLTLVVLDFLGQVRARAIVDHAYALPATVQAFVATQIARLEDDSVIDLSRLAGIGVAMPDDLGRVHLPSRPPEYAVWTKVDMRDLFGPVYAGEVRIANDATAAAIGELHFGHGLINPNFFYVLVSAGLGGGLVIDGHVLPGARGRSGEIGFLPLAQPVGAERQLQDVVSLSGLYEALRSDGFLLSAPGDLKTLDAGSQKIADAWCVRAAALLAPPLETINAAINPGAIYIGGRLPAALIDRLADQTRDVIAKRTGLPGLPMAPVQRAALACDAAAMGAAVLPFSDLFLPAPSVLRKRVI